MPTKKQLKEAAESAKRVDWTKIDELSNREIEAAAKSDPDNPLLTKEQIQRMRLVIRKPGKKTPSSRVNGLQMGEGRTLRRHAEFVV